MEWKKYLVLFKNKYIIVVLFLFIYILFIEDVTVFNLLERKGKRGQLINEKERKLKSIQEVKDQLESLKDIDQLEKFARESYYFKKDNEDVFVIRKE